MQGTRGGLHRLARIHLCLPLVARTFRPIVSFRKRVLTRHLRKRVRFPSREVVRGVSRTREREFCNQATRALRFCTWEMGFSRGAETSSRTHTPQTEDAEVGGEEAPFSPRGCFFFAPMLSLANRSKDTLVVQATQPLDMRIAFEILSSTGATCERSSRAPIKAGRTSTFFSGPLAPVLCPFQQLDANRKKRHGYLSIWVRGRWTVNMTPRSYVQK